MVTVNFRKQYKDTVDKEDLGKQEEQIVWQKIKQWRNSMESWRMRKCKDGEWGRGTHNESKKMDCRDGIEEKNLQCLKRNKANAMGSINRKNEVVRT